MIYYPYRKVEHLKNVSTACKDFNQLTERYLLSSYCVQKTVPYMSRAGDN